VIRNDDRKAANNMKSCKNLLTLQIVLLVFLFSSIGWARVATDIPVFKIAPEGSTIHFAVKASVSLEGRFDQWDATLTFASRDASTGVLDVKIAADSVNTGSGMQNGKLKGKDFFNVKQDPYITFHSTKVEQTGLNTFELPGTFTIRGVSKPETLIFTATGQGRGEGEIKGTMAFDRRDYVMNSGIPFFKVADRAEVSVDLKVKRVSGPPLTFNLP
jgi:polyisoprenoid-binding protein YceI